MLKHSLLAVAITTALTPLAGMASEIGVLAPVVIIGTDDEAQTLPGSGAVIKPEQMAQEVATDVNQVLKTVPGIYVHEEDGAGLRPNIGIRGATAERSEKITLMEDGVLAAPAPYSNPAAYYFPTAMRMSAIEVLKGAPLLRYGPQTTGGVVNLVSTPIPEDAGGSLTVVLDDRGSSDVHAHYGAHNGAWLWQLETVQREGDGFKEIDRSNNDSGFDIADYVLKLGWQGQGQSLLLKSQYSEESSNETYLGLTDADFAADPNRRYGLSSLDQMNNSHRSLTLTHNKQWGDNITSTTTAYRNSFDRDWFKLSGGGSYINDANGGDATAQGILDGNLDVSGLNYKHNNRAYLSQGVQVNLDISQGAHLISVGARQHKDEMDRFQPTEVFDQMNGSLVYQSTTLATGSNNRQEEAKATSLWLLDDWQVSEQLNIHLALRYEDVSSSRVQYADVGRSVIDSTRSNDSDELLPGASFTYDLDEQWQALAGFHQGFSPLGGGAKATEAPETSDNWEAGIRYRDGALFAEAIAFYSDFSNKAENCSLASPCSNGDTSGSFITGAAQITGLELQAGTTLQRTDITIPLQLAYTYTQAEISGNNTSGFADGDQLKDVPEHIMSLRAGIEHANGWDSYAVAKYISDMCVTTGCNNSNNAFASTESLFVMDLITHYPLAQNVDVFLKAENVFDQQKIVSRTPDGARPNKPFTVSLGMKHTF